MLNIDPKTQLTREASVSYEKSLYRLIKRVLPEHHHLFKINLTDNTRNEYFKIIHEDDLIILEGNTPISIAAGLNWHLKYSRNSHISWSGSNIEMPKKMGPNNIPLILSSRFKKRYYLNYCTFSYSMPWWNWERWEKEIDFMALNGINMVLALVGQEAAWQQFLQKLGCNQKDIFDFLPGPAYLAWGWLNNLDGWGGPTTQNWIDDQKELQLKILKRLRSLKITPILQAFVGRVPKVFKEMFPDANIIKLPGWYEYDGVYFLDPSDPLFSKLSKLFFDVQTEMYGNDHYFAGDIFHEIDSSDKTRDYMGHVYKGIEDNLVQCDKNAKWFLQSWTIRTDSLSSLDKNHTIILDMFCESESKWDKTENFNGHKWIWGIINNFGGRSGLGGPMKKIAAELQRAKEGAAKDKLCGIGVAPEGIGNNAPVYELLWEMNWRENPVSIEDWFIEYAHRRYGFTSQNLKNAWIKLLDTVYSGPSGYAPIESVICAAPSLKVKSVSSNGSSELYYKNTDLLQAAEDLLSESEKIKNSEAYIYDVIDITRQFGVNLANTLYKKLSSKFYDKDIPGFKFYSETFLNLCEDLDELLSCSKHFSLGSWLESAKQKARDDKDLRLFEWNARRQITLWSSPEIKEFHDYANKQWSGLIKDYYIPRWEEFIRECLQSLNLQNKFDESAFKKKMIILAVEWSAKTDKYEIESGKDGVLLAKKFIDKYKACLEGK